MIMTYWDPAFIQDAIFDVSLRYVFIPDRANSERNVSLVNGKRQLVSDTFLIEKIDFSGYQTLK